MCEFSIEDFVCPRTGVGPAEDPEVGLNFLVDTFSFAVRLGVVCSEEG